MQVQAYVSQWQRLHPRPTLQTERHNRQMVAPFVRDFGHRQLGSLTRDDALRFAAAHPSSVRYVRTLLSDALEDGLVGANVMAGVRGRRCEGRLARMDVLAPDEVKRIIRTVDPALRPMVVLAACTGLRLTEAAMLEPDDVDRSKSPVIVQVRHGKGGRQRPVFVPAAVASVLDELPFRTPTGKRWTRATVARYFKPAARAAGRPDATFHCLRHYAASWLVDRGAQPVDLAIQLHGTEDPSTVFQWYARARRDKAFDRLAAVAA